MTLDQALTVISESVMRDDLEDQYVDFLNRAVREAATRHSFDCMKVKTEEPLEIPAGETSVDLPEDFKEFQNGRFPVLYVTSGSDSDDDELRKVPVYARSELERLDPIFRPTPHLIFTQDNDAKQIALPTAQTDDWSLTVYYFAFPAELDPDDSDSDSDESETTPLLREYPNMILSKTLSLIFQSINDPVWEVHEAQFQREIAVFTGEDIVVSKPAPREDKE